MDKSISFYEEVLVLHPNSSLEDQKEIFCLSEKVIESFKGSIHSLDTFGSRPIANTADKKLSMGLYFCMIFSASSQAVTELRRKLRINNKVIYFHHERLKKGQTFEERRKQFLNVLENSSNQEKERQAKLQKRIRG